MSKKTLIIIVIVVVVLAASFAAWYFTRKKKVPETYVDGNDKRRTINIRDGKGNIIGSRVVTGTPKNGDKIDALADAGAMIKKTGLIIPGFNNSKAKANPVVAAYKADPSLMGPPSA